MSELSDNTVCNRFKHGPNNVKGRQRGLGRNHLGIAFESGLLGVGEGMGLGEGRARSPPQGPGMLRAACPSWAA